MCYFVATGLCKCLKVSNIFVLVFRRNDANLKNKETAIDISPDCAKKVVSTYVLFYSCFQIYMYFLVL